MTEVAAAWALLDAPTKATWKTYAANISRNGWQLYMQEYCYRKKYDLSIPPTPNEYHQMNGLKLSNPSGSEIIQAQRYDITAQGEMTVRFNYTKVENSETEALPFRAHAIAYYFEAGENKSEEHTFEAPAGNVSWNQVEFTFGTTGRYYFELIITFELDHYDADVIIDNFVITDDIGILENEPWHVKAGKEWVYQVRTRKMGWEFVPAAGVPYIEIVYTGV
jgi:hypothetical protein